MTMPPATLATDTELLRQLRDGVSAAFQTLYQRHQAPVYRFALLRTGSGDTAADIVQEVFMGLLTGSFHYDPLRGLLQNFLFGVARKLILKHEQPRLRLSSLPDAGPDDESAQELASDDGEPLARLLENETAEQVRRALAQLAPHYRDAVILYELHDMSYLDIADICQVDIGTVRSRLSRGRAALAKRLAAHRPAALQESI
ncbi:sigma-70 family RNA polymerase sigma factor [Massilia sp. CCM 8733]|uniref:Sigma-70 family RNA polymerase sigma factor n=1 Tax=Massilia mucilaginosa TaxID=2609282 RepID=A0ABX0P403_9BURK|nr:RNA polymerase sigma factor [Massilia mucilaginosa]NHZ93778.1 sigma-70 family RNA polymerase sigma factor [Massilia mucilaginosa]